MKGSEIRALFLKYFQGQGHTVVRSSALVPEDDPSLLFTNAGMNQFKPVFLGSETRAYTRATSSQKCVRAGGKHNDLENVGVTARHHTFFEMLGNFSFGDYFKEQAITYAWDLLVNVMRLDPERLWVSVHHSDDEAFGLWRDRIGVKPERIVRLGDKDNFWAMGETGPCGPCSEIIYDQGPEVGCGRPDCNLECGCDRFLEIWNLVFMQYNRDSQGVLNPLPKPSIDTGMGLERITAVIQGAKSNYDTDLFQPLIQYAAKLAGKTYGADADMDTSIRVIADHARASAFLVCDGVLPSNEGRGYVLRRIIRRACRHGKLLGFGEAFLHKVALKVIDEMADIYPDLHARRDFIDKVIANEEERFLITLDKGLALLAEVTAGLPAGADIPGEAVFKLYDTFGFPVDLTEDIARKKGLRLDKAGFEAHMELQREKARAGSSFSNVEAGSGTVSGIPATTFLGYETMTADAQVLAILTPDGQKKREKLLGGQGLVVTDQTPFYGESGGQVGDRGMILFESGEARVVNTIKSEGVFLHEVQVERGSLAVGQNVLLRVDENRRRAIMRHHSATHLLQRALQDVLGAHAHQSGSLVDENRLRFDFTHFSALSPEEIARIEEIVNRFVLEDLPVKTTLMAKDQAVSTGAMALFGEKYGDEVRVVTMGEGVSNELCGGTHCRSTGEIGAVKIISEGSVSAGLRRIEAYAGLVSLAHYRELSQTVAELADRLKCAPSEIFERLGSLQTRLKEQENKIRELGVRIATGAGADDEENFSARGVKVAIKKIEDSDISQMRDVGDRLKEKLGSGVIFLAAPGLDKATFMIMVTSDLTATLDAGKIMKTVLASVNGRGGGKAGFAQGGAENTSLENAVAAFKKAMQGDI
ncbi:MAG: alanine--tRNA ligase [Syntrophaceae bacterium]